MHLSRTGRMALLASVIATGAIAASSQASVIAYEGFDYALGSDMNNANGWQNQNWSGNYSATVVAGLTYPGVTSTGNGFRMYEGGEFLSIAGAPTDFYVSVLINKASGGGNVGVFFQQGWNQAQVAGFGFNGSSLYAAASGGYANNKSPTGSALTIGSTVMLVAHIDQAAKTITAWDYANPTNTVTTTYTAGAINTLNVYGDFGGNATTDEILVGTTLADVTPVPEPASIGLLGLGGLMLARRRRA